MRPDLPVSSILQDASFALFESLRGSRAVALDPAGRVVATCARPVDPAACGLAFTSTGEAALELVLEQDGEAGPAWVHAACDARGPQLAVYLAPTRPTLVLRFAPPSVLPLEDERFLLRERPTFPSHDGLQDARKLIVAGLSRRFAVPHVGGWLHLGTWDALDRSWQPETARRVLAAAVLLERARGEGS